jgi:site-specific DNA recombinase
LHQLLADVAPGYLIVCRDHFRLGRDAIDSAVTVRELVRDRRARLFYYSSGQEVAFQSAIDAAMTFIQGVGAQMELEAIRSRTREALRQRVRSGRIAGGACFGYRNVRQKDASGREFTTAVIDETQADLVRWMFNAFREGWGLHRMAVSLNERRVPSPSAGRRGTGSWSTIAIRDILRRERYRGVYVHGVKDRIKRGGKRIAVAADPKDILRVEVPEWRIVDEVTWCAVQSELETRAHGSPDWGGPKPKYPLTGIATCATCGGAIGVMNTRTGEGRVRAYACSFHHKRGNAVCPVTLYQPIDEVNGALVDFLKASVLTESVVARVIAEVKAQVEGELSAPADTGAAEQELAKLRTEQKRYAAMVAQAPDIPELLVEMRKRQNRIRDLEAELGAANRLPEMKRDLLAKVERSAREKLAACEKPWAPTARACARSSRLSSQTACACPPPNRAGGSAGP